MAAWMVRFARLCDRDAGRMAGGEAGPLDEDTRELARAKTEAVAEGLVSAKASPDVLRRALRDAKSWFGGAASWVGHALGDILKSEAAQKTLGTITEAATKATIASLMG